MIVAKKYKDGSIVVIEGNMYRLTPSEQCVTGTVVFSTDWLYAIDTSDRTILVGPTVTWKSYDSLKEFQDDVDENFWIFAL